jgi:hypothetical protein
LNLCSTPYFPNPSKFFYIENVEKGFSEAMKEFRIYIEYILNLEPLVLHIREEREIDRQMMIMIMIMIIIIIIIIMMIMILFCIRKFQVCVALANIVRVRKFSLYYENDTM